MKFLFIVNQFILEVKAGVFRGTSSTGNSNHSSLLLQVAIIILQVQLGYQISLNSE